MGKIDFRDPNVQIAGAIIFVAVTIAYVFFATEMVPIGFRARSSNIASLETEYDRVSADLMKAKQTASRLPQVKADYDALSAKWNEAQKLLPTEKEMAELLTQVTLSGERSGVQFHLFEPRPGQPRDIYVENPIDVKVQGGYHSVGKFLGRLSNLQRIVNVKSINLKSIANPVGADLPELVEAELKLSAYTLLSESQRAQAGTATGATAASASAQPQKPAQQNKGGNRGH